MPDLDVEFGDDFGLTPDGDLAFVDGIDLDNQHIERRLLTPLQAYLFHLDYAAGLPQRIGDVGLDANIKAIVRAQLALEATVAAIPPPTIDVTLNADTNGLCVIAIGYTNAISGTTEAISLEVPGSR